MRVCIIAGDAVGGIRKHVHDILNAKPIEVEALYIHSDVSDAAAKYDFECFRYKSIERLQLRITKNPTLSDLMNIIIIWRACSRKKVDIFHGHGAKGGLYARLVGFLMSKPVIFTPHGGSVHSRFGKVKSLLFAWTEYILKFVTTLFVFESRYTREAFRKLAGDIPDGRESISFNGVQLDHFAPKTAWNRRDRSEVRLLTVGMLSMVKGQDVAIQATAILKTRGWKVSLDLCGDGEDRALLKSLTHTLQLDNQVRFHGDVDDVRPYYDACDIVVIPSRFESFGYVAVEAALMKRPVVASATGGLLETVIDRETGLGFSIGCPTALANAIEQTLIDVDATKLRINAGWVRALALFDVNQMTTRLYSTYRQLVLR